MALFGGNSKTSEKLSKAKLISPRDMYGNVLKGLSGAGQTRSIKYDIFYQIIAFRGVVEGVGCSTVVANTALCLAELGLTVCVVDTSILAPVQDILLKTGYESVEESKRLDWFDMPYTKASVLHSSKLSNKVSVLSFYGKNRGIVDALSVSDTDSLVELAFTQLHNKFDFILVDCCSELTKVNTACMQQSHHIIQVWNDSPTCVGNIESFINNCATVSCSIDKMKHVVYSKIMQDVMGNIDDVLQQYGLVKISESPFSVELARIAVMDKPMYQYESREPDVVAFTDFIISIACFLCNISDDHPGKGTPTSDQIMNGEVDGTVTKKLRDREKAKKEKLNIKTSLKEADESMKGGGK